MLTVSSPSNHSLLRYKWRSLPRSPKLDGIEPLRSLILSSNISKLASRPNSVGIEPLRSLPISFNVTKFDRLPSSAGINPLRALSESVSDSKLARFPSSDGSDPERPLAISESRVTRPLLLVSTPCHLSMGLSLGQLVFLVQLVPSVAS